MSIQNVTVNLNVTVDASGNIDVFGQEAPSITNKVVAAFNMSPSCLYEMLDPSDNTGSAIFEFWEPSDALGTRKASLATSKPNYNYLLSEFGYYLSKVFTNSLDASMADPFNQSKYLNTPEYYTHPTFGRLALSSYAHYLFGHVAATAAITNDANFISTMDKYENSNYDDFNYSTSTSYSTFSSTNANLAKRLVDKIANLTDSQVLDIVNQVLGQDATRAMDVDNNEPAPGAKQPLKFYEGDKIYLNVQLTTPSVTYGNGQQAAPLPSKFASDAGDNNGTLDRSYTIEITLQNHIKNLSLGFADDSTRLNTIQFNTSSQYLLANSSVVNGAKNTNELYFFYNSDYIGGININGTNSLTTSTGILDASTNAPIFNSLTNSYQVNGRYHINPMSFLYKQSLQNGMTAFYLTLDSELNATIPLSNIYKVSLPSLDFTITGTSVDNNNRLISFTSNRTIPGGFNLRISRAAGPNTGAGSVYNFVSLIELTDGTTTVQPESGSSDITTSQLSITTEKTYTLTINNLAMTAVNNIYRIVLLHPSYPGIGAAASYIRFGGSYLFGIEYDSVNNQHNVIMH
jgi:hypothetical protein